MNIAEKKKFYAKILLLGEYSIILGGEAITVPFERFAGHFDFISEKDETQQVSRQSNLKLKKYLDYLLNPEVRTRFQFPLKLEQLKNDLDKGMYFKSTIPEGYGAGSSGALVAAIFYYYSNQFSGEQDANHTSQLAEFRQQLALMESYFHGSSSGLDPLSSLLGRTLRIDAQKRISFPELPLFARQSQITIFLLDTLNPGNTKPLVDGFKQQIADKVLDGELLVALNNQIVQALLNRDQLFFDSFLRQLSLFQLENMKPMIPENIRPLWQRGIDTGEYTLKLCGSGGGGFVLGFTENFEKAKAICEQEGLNSMVLL
ncbi:MAG: mevalonate kinase [Bacteroidetes bacterium]|nr:MAG: mevalonate kinase [Bacteroidota bacterium]